ncbi:TPA: hypothetical protein ACPVXW_004502 [Vibrio parahaemolyticus]
MSKNQLEGIDEFPLTSASAKKLINELASNHTLLESTSARTRESVWFSVV